MFEKYEDWTISNQAPIETRGRLNDYRKIYNIQYVPCVTKEMRMEYKYTLDEVKEIVRSKNSNVVLLERNKVTEPSGRQRTTLRLRCECGAEFSRTFDKVVKCNKLLCNKCAQKYAKLKRKKRERKKYLINLNNRGYKLLNVKDDMLSNHFVDVVDVDGYRGRVYPNTKNKFLPFSPHHNKKWFVYNCNLLAQKNGVNSRVLRVLEKSIYAEPTIEVKCECGKNFYTPYRKFVYGTKRYCDLCNKAISRYEKEVALFLDKNNIKYKREFVINSCKDVAPLPFDFWLKDYNILIEVDGQQHFRPIKFNNMSDEKAQKLFRERQRVDKIKDDYCKQWDICLIRIPYWEIEDGTYQNKIMDIIKIE